MATNPNKSRFWSDFIYDAWLWTFSVLIDLFFREVHPRSSWKVPRQGPVLIVAAPHANQFVDPLILMRVLRHDCKRRVCFLIAEKSTKRPFVGWGSRMVGAVPVGRALDKKKAVEGAIYLPDPEGAPDIIRGTGVDFTDSKTYQIGGLLVLPTVSNEAANAEIKEIISENEIRLKKPFKGNAALRQLTGQEVYVQGTKEGIAEKPDNKYVEGYQGSKFSVAPHVDQSKVYEAVFKKLHDGGCIGIFPEGGSHDRTELLPLKAGVAIMALGALAENPDCGVKIVPCGMNYFHAHKFRSRAVVEFGTPIEIPPETVQMYKNGGRREAVAQVLDTVYQGLITVTVTSPDYDTLMLIQAVRRLYNPKGKKLPLPMIVELNRRLVKGYTTYKDDPRIISLKKSVLSYNKELMMLNIRDHQISYARFSIPKVVFTLLYRLAKLAVLTTAVLPGLVLFAPVFIAGKTISIKKSREALAASTVKIQGKDVMATWKLLVSMALAPVLYTWYTAILTYWAHRNRIQGYMSERVPLWSIVVFGYIFFPMITYMALRFGEVGMDIAKSLRPLVLSLGPTSHNTMFRLRQKRQRLVEEVTEVINELGPELYPDFDHQRIVNDPYHPLSPSVSRPQTPRPGTGGRRSESYGFNPLGLSASSPTNSKPSQTPGAGIGGGSGIGSSHLPRNESFGNLGGIGIFATRPGTPNRSRSRARSDSGSSKDANGAPLRRRSSGLGVGGGDLGMTTINSKDSMDEVSKKIRGAMRERGRRRRSEDMVEGEGGWELADADVDGEVDDEDEEVIEERRKDV
ncbi:hypothetical protein AAFC00_004912 [Neodothiora populina]|uniref:Phospholipid/glycerol acyltransferase domain-containing protein n=1 Tax=Neodothiora populina TaxID=2781224 RepID=A0ABR3P3K8_9PEZI